MRYTIMTKRTIKEIKSMLTASPVQEHLLLELQKDSRKGVQQLLRSYERKYKQEQALLALQEEKRQFDAQYKHTNTILAGVDEAGRGPLAGPVTAAAVIFPEDFSLPGLTDSKQLNEAQRELYFEQIKMEAIAYHLSIIEDRSIDLVTINEESYIAMCEDI